MSETLWQLAETGNARWIFPACTDGAVNQIVDFLHPFDVSSDLPVPDAELWISADTDFMVWLNGRLLGYGQYSDYPDRKTFERLPVGEALRPGSNTLAITVFYNGRTSSVYRRGDPGLVFALQDGHEVLAASGTETHCRQNPCYHSGPIAVVSGQLAYTFGYDARGEDGFHDDGYVPGGQWRPIREKEVAYPDCRAVLAPRPVPRLVDGGRTSVCLFSAGCFRLDMDALEGERGVKAIGQGCDGLALADGSVVSPAWQMQYAQLTEKTMDAITGVSPGTLLDASGKGLAVAIGDLAGDDGVYLIVDLGCEEVGHLELEIEAPAGTLVDVGYGEHLDDGHVRAFVGGRSFAGRYICREGRQAFTHRFLRWAGRYLQIHVHAPAFTLYRLGLCRTEYPVSARGELDTGSPFHRRLLDVGCRTLQLCMHEHYEDTPWREQALYANDARTQALCGYYAFGETAMPKASFTLLGQGLREDGFLNLTAPAQPPVTIPSFTLVWMLAVRDYVLYTGDDSLARTFLPQMQIMLAGFLAERRGGLWPLRREKGIWHFYDWSAGMSGYSDDDFANGLDADAPLNCFLILALEAVRQMLDWCGETGGNALAAVADDLRQAVEAQFWDAGEAAFRTHGRAPTLAALTQALAVLAGVGSESLRDRVLERLARPDSGLAEPGLSQSFYLFEALMTRRDRYAATVLSRIESTWGAMLDAGATTFWETIKGASDFSNAGSLCHGWSAVPVYVLYHDLLGIRPLEPGFRRFAADPVTSVATAGSGVVPVPAGQIRLRWRHDGGDAHVDLDAPPPCIHSPPRDSGQF